MIHPPHFAARLGRRWRCRGGAAVLAVAMALLIWTPATWAQAKAPDAAGLRRMQGLLDQLRDSAQTPAARREAAATLLAEGWEIGNTRLNELLRSNADPGVRRAIIGAIVTADPPDPRFTGALLSILDDEDPTLRDEAAAALGRYRSSRLTDQLFGIASNASRPASQRIGAINALRDRHSREVIGRMIQLTDAADPQVRAAVFAALRRMTGHTAATQDAAAWRQWWTKAGELTDQQFSILLMENFAAVANDLQARLTKTTDALLAAQRREYDAADETIRAQILQRLLADPMTDVQLLGLQLIRRRVANAQPVGDELRLTMRQLLTAPDAAVRASVARLLETLADAEAADRVVGLLPGERDPAVLAAYLTLLARSPKAAAVEPALQMLNDPGLRSPAASLIAGAADANLLTEQQQQQALGAARRHLADNPAPDRSMLALLGRLGESPDLNVLEHFLRHDDVVLRRAAADAFALERWPVKPILEYLNDSSLGQNVLQIVARRRNRAEVSTFLTVLNHQPQAPEQLGSWRDALAGVFVRLDEAGLIAADDHLAPDRSRIDLHEHLLQAASAPALVGEGNGAVETRHIEAALRLARLYRRTLQPAKAAAVYQRLSIRSDMTDAMRRRMTAGNLAVTLDQQQIDEAMASTAELFEADDSLTVAELVTTWLDAIDRAIMASNMDLARAIMEKVRPVFGDRLDAAAESRLAEFERRINPEPTTAAPTSGTQ